MTRLTRRWPSPWRFASTPFLPTRALVPANAPHPAPDDGNGARRLQELAEDLDVQLTRAGYLEPGQGPFGGWVLQRTLRDMLRFLSLGFELELYAPCELRGIYWCAAARGATRARPPACPARLPTALGAAVRAADRCGE